MKKWRPGIWSLSSFYTISSHTPHRDDCVTGLSSSLSSASQNDKSWSRPQCRCICLTMSCSLEDDRTDQTPRHSSHRDCRHALTPLIKMYTNMTISSEQCEVCFVPCEPWKDSQRFLLAFIFFNDISFLLCLTLHCFSTLFSTRIRKRTTKWSVSSNSIDIGYVIDVSHLCSVIWWLKQYDVIHLFTYIWFYISMHLVRFGVATNLYDYIGNALVC